MSTTQIDLSQLSAELTKSILRDLDISRASVSTVDITDGTVGDDTGVVIMDVSGTITVDITASGANGLDTGAEASSTFYYIYLIFNPTTEVLAGLFSISATSPTLPSGYTLKRLVGVVRNDGSSDFISFLQVGENFDYTDRFNVLSGGTATSATTIDVSAFVPDSISSSVRLRCFGSVTGVGTGGAKFFAVSSKSTLTISDAPVSLVWEFEVGTPARIERNQTNDNLNLIDTNSAKIYYIQSSATGASGIIDVLGFRLKL